MWLLVFLSCISRSTHELVEVQLDATRSALSARNAQCYLDVSARDSTIAGLESHIQALEEDRKVLGDRNAQLEAELDARRKELAAFVTQTSKPVAVPKKGKAPPPMEPLVVSTADEVKASIELKSVYDFETQRRAEAHETWVRRFQALADKGYAQVLAVDGRTVVRIPSKVIFNEGQITVSPRGEVVLADLVAAVRGAPAESIAVVAHTDESAYHTAEFNSSWELGFAEAMTVVRTLGDANIQVKLSAGSAAGTQPIDTTPEGQARNQRIELWVETDASLPAVPSKDAPKEEGAPAGETPAPAPEAPAQPG
jgi:chemotaxis protein MotB